MIYDLGIALCAAGPSLFLIARTRWGKLRPGELPGLAWILPGGRKSRKAAGEILRRRV